MVRTLKSGAYDSTLKEGVYSLNTYCLGAYSPVPE